MLPDIRVYTRQGCHLCEDLLEQIEPLLRGRATLTLIDIDRESGFLAQYNDKVPVVASSKGEVCRYFLDRDALESALAT